MLGRVSKAIKGPSCVLLVIVSIGAAGIALRHTESQANLLTSAKSVSAMRADFDQYACLESKLDRLVPAGVEVYDANPESLYSQRIFEFGSARDTFVPKPSPGTWIVRSVAGTACGHFDLRVVAPRGKGTP